MAFFPHMLSITSASLSCALFFCKNTWSTDKHPDEFSAPPDQHLPQLSSSPLCICLTVALHLHAPTLLLQGVAFTPSNQTRSWPWWQVAETALDERQTQEARRSTEKGVSDLWSREKVEYLMRSVFLMFLPTVTFSYTNTANTSLSRFLSRIQQKQLSGALR